MENIHDLSFEIEKTLKCIPGVLFTKVITEENVENFNIEEIHIVATTERNPKQISRDIQSIMSAKFDLDFDHKKVSIAQIKHENTTNFSQGSKRLQIAGIDYTIKGNQVKTEVILQCDKKTYTAEEVGPNTLSNAYRILANATLSAIHQYIGMEHVFAIEDIERVKIGKKEAVVVAVGVISSEYEEILLGSALIKNDIRETVVKATLDALNRRLPKFS